MEMRVVSVLRVVPCKNLYREPLTANCAQQDEGINFVAFCKGGWLQDLHLWLQFQSISAFLVSKTYSVQRVFKFFLTNPEFKSP